MARVRAEDFEDKQRSILRNAAAVFAEQGMSKASMSLIASQANVSKALLYHYYPGKDALIFAIIYTHLEELDAAIVAADDPTLPPRQRLGRLIATVLECYQGSDVEHTMQLNAQSGLNEDQKVALKTIERQIVRRFSTILRDLNPNLESTQRSLLAPVTMSLFGIMNWVYMWFKDSGPLSREEYADMITTLVLDGVGAIR